MLSKAPVSRILKICSWSSISWDTQHPWLLNSCKFGSIFPCQSRLATKLFLKTHSSTFMTCLVWEIGLYCTGWALDPPLWTGVIQASLSVSSISPLYMEDGNIPAISNFTPFKDTLRDPIWFRGCSIWYIIVCKSCGKKRRFFRFFFTELQLKKFWAWAVTKTGLYWDRIPAKPFDKFQTNLILNRETLNKIITFIVSATQ